MTTREDPFKKSRKVPTMYRRESAECDVAGASSCSSRSSGSLCVSEFQPSRASSSPQKSIQRSGPLR